MMTELPHMGITERALAEVEPTLEGRRRRRWRKRRRKVQFPLLNRGIRRSPEGSVLTSRPGSCDVDSSIAAQVNAHSRGQTCDDAAAADSTTEGGTTTRDASDNPDLQMALPINQSSQPPERMDPNTWLTDGADGDPPDHHGGSGPNSNSAASTAPHPGRTPTSLRVMYLNAGGISGKTQDLQTLVQSQNIHVVLLGETKLRPRQELQLPNFFVYRRDEVSPQGIAYRGMLYSCEDHTPKILAGDLNATHTVWGSRVLSPAGRQLLQDAEDYGYDILGPDTPSHVPTDPRFGADVLDIVLYHRLPFPIHVKVLYDMDTQHLPILITLGTTAHLTPARPQAHRTNWSAYQRALEELHIVKSFSSPEKVDSAASRLNHEIQTALWARTRCPRVKRDLNRVPLEPDKRYGLSEAPPGKRRLDRQARTGSPCTSSVAA
ncbi:Probable RNA-directed DNA polymerase from transposon BS [Eumeta japonica]|uniref:Probable RNA-directed DNA polymerase from transposon BS n=1 Tax=Eumeta variegata TaxID=151549 RepID=A0A4C1WUP9_EUMVA|nr:Probable RNA-directed DNA polymerase from transposon BS [Eumeta japonica]